MLGIGTTLNGLYEIIKTIGAGGTGEVYLAYHLRLQKYVVVKMIKENFVGVINTRAEVDVLKSLHHQYLPQVYDFCQEEDRVYTVMDYIDGMALDEYYKAGYPVDETRVCKWLEQLCEVLVYIHSRKPAIIHSDIKPGNIMIGTDGNAYLIDFNISFSEDEGDVQGISQSYASHEQIERFKVRQMGYNVSAMTVDARSDIYSLGASFYYIMTGIEPYDGIGDTNPIGRFLIPYSASITRVIEKAMYTDVKKRYQSSSRMLHEVKYRRHFTLQYRMIILGIVTIVVFSAGVVALGVSSGIAEYNRKAESVISNEIEKTEYQVRQGQYDDAIKSALDSLKKNSNKSYYAKNSDKEAYLLYLVGECCFKLSAYSEASRYYELAIETDNSVAEYYREYAIALMYDGQIEEAETIIQLARERGLDQDSLKELEGEMLYSDNRLGDAEKVFLDLLGSTRNELMKYRALEALCAIYKLEKRYDQMLSLVSTTELSGEYEVMHTRLYVEAYVLCGNNAADSERRCFFYENSVRLYEQCGNKNIFTVNDTLNIALAMQQIGKYDSAISLINVMIEKYPDNYRCYLYRAYINYYQLEASNSFGSYQSVVDDYNTAKKKYEENGIYEPDSELIGLGNMVDALK